MPSENFQEAEVLLSSVENHLLQDVKYFYTLSETCVVQSGLPQQTLALHHYLTDEDATDEDGGCRSMRNVGCCFCCHSSVNAVDPVRVNSKE